MGNSEVIRKKNILKSQNIWGEDIGILCLESYYYKPVGHIKNAKTFDFPVRYKVIKGATPERVIEQVDHSLLGSFIQGAKELEEDGVKAITTSCGFLALFQKEIADAVSIPVFTSSLIQISMIGRMINRNQRVGIITAKESALTRRHLESVGADLVPAYIVGMGGEDEFNKVMLKREKISVDIDRLENEVLDIAMDLVRKKSDVGAILLECTDLSPFSKVIQEVTNLPVFDIITLVNMVRDAIAAKKYTEKF